MWYIAKKGFRLFSSLVLIGALFYAHSMHQSDTSKQTQDVLMIADRVHNEPVYYTSMYRGPWMDGMLVWDDQAIDDRFERMIRSYTRTHDPTELAQTVNEWKDAMPSWTKWLNNLEYKSDYELEEKKAMEHIQQLIVKGRRVLEQHAKRIQH